jgi:hypothetical protein
LGAFAKHLSRSIKPIKLASLIFVALAASGMLSAPPAKAASSAFDGTWAVTLGKPYKYDVNAHFKGKQGSGRRIGGRIGNFAFAKG